MMQYEAIILTNQSNASPPKSRVAVTNEAHLSTDAQSYLHGISHPKCYAPSSFLRFDHVPALILHVQYR